MTVSLPAKLSGEGDERSRLYTKHQTTFPHTANWHKPHQTTTPHKRHSPTPPTGPPPWPAVLSAPSNHIPPPKTTSTRQVHSPRCPSHSRCARSPSPRWRCSMPPTP